MAVVAENGETMPLILEEKDNFTLSKNGGYNSIFESSNRADILSFFEFLAKNGKSHILYNYLKSQTLMVTKTRDIPMFGDNADVFNSYIQSCKQEKTVVVIGGKEQ